MYSGDCFATSYLDLGKKFFFHVTVPQHLSCILFSVGISCLSHTNFICRKYLIYSANCFITVEFERLTYCSLDRAKTVLFYRGE